MIRLLVHRAARSAIARAFAFLAAVAALNASTQAQVRVVSYNVAQLQGNLADLQAVLVACHADDKAGFSVPVGAFVFQEVRSNNIATLHSIIQSSAPAGVHYALATYTNTDEDDFGGAQALFYRTDLLSEAAAAHVDIYTGAGRDADRWRLQLNGYGSQAAGMYVYSAHLKASEEFANERLMGMQAIRSNANTLGAGANIIYAGDWNLYTNSEPAYAHITAAGSAQAWDPLGIGSWAGSGNAGKHTQSPRLNSSATLVGGGLDDRFDFQLATTALNDATGLARMNMTFGYRTLGNDAAHYNQSINAGTNLYYPGDPARSNALADALFDASDHLPVIVDYQIPAMLSASIPASFGRVIQGATHSLPAEVHNSAPVEVESGADILQYSATASLALSGNVAGSVLPMGDFDSISFPLSTGVVGPATGRITFTSASQGVQPASLVVESSGLVVRHANASFAATSNIDATTVEAAFAPDSGVHALPIAIHNFGFDAWQALLDIDSVSGLATPFGLAGGLSSGIAGSPATMTFTFDTAHAGVGVHSTNVVIYVSDEDLPGAAASTLALTLEVAIVELPKCAADVDRDGFVNVSDLLAVIGSWGVCAAPPAPCPADINADGLINVSDLLAVIANWGPCP